MNRTLYRANRSLPDLHARRCKPHNEDHLFLQPFEPARRKDLISLVSCALNSIFTSPARMNDRLPEPKQITAFHSISVPGMSIQSYFKRLVEYIDCSGEVFVLMLAHLNRIHMTKPEFAIDSLTIHRLLLTALMVSAKFFDDHVYNNAQWAGVGGVSCRELNSLEREFLILMDYSLFVTTDTFLATLSDLCRPILHTKCNGECKATDITAHYPGLIIPTSGDSMLDLENKSLAATSIASLPPQPVAATVCLLPPILGASPKLEIASGRDIVDMDRTSDRSGENTERSEFGNTEMSSAQPEERENENGSSAMELGRTPPTVAMLNLSRQQQEQQESESQHGGLFPFIKLARREADQPRPNRIAVPPLDFASIAPTLPQLSAGHRGDSSRRSTAPASLINRAKSMSVMPSPQEMTN